MDEGLYRDAALARFYDLDNGWTADRTFCLRLAAGKAAVLDLGCGTGDLAIRIAAEQRAAVTGVDPARAMLDIARRKAGAARVRWVEADARWLDLGQRFDLIVMTGHAFQALLTDQDRALALAAVARHLAPGGCFVFDQRVAVGHGLAPTGHAMCHACRRPITDQDRAHPAFEDGVSCPRCITEFDDARRQRFRERQRQVALAEARGTRHLGCCTECGIPIALGYSPAGG